jgi:hypothetical protein
MLYVHVAENHRREIPPEILTVAGGESDPDRRVLCMLGARGSQTARSSRKTSNSGDLRSSAFATLHQPFSRRSPETAPEILRNSPEPTRLLQLVLRRISLGHPWAVKRERLHPANAPRFDRCNLRRLASMCRSP